MSLIKILRKLKKRLFHDPELAARQIYEFVITTQSPEVVSYFKRLLYNHQSVNEKDSLLIEEKPAGVYSKFISPLDDSD